MLITMKHCNFSLKIIKFPLITPQTARFGAYMIDNFHSHTTKSGILLQLFTIIAYILIC